MLTATEQLAEAERIQQLLVEAQESVALRLTGSLAVWYYCHDRTEILDRSHRGPRDIDFIYSTAGGSAVIKALEAAGYTCDMRLALESQGSRIRARRTPYKVDAFADPVVLRQTLHLGARLERCSPCISLTDLLLLKLQLSTLDQRDQIDLCALLASSYVSSDDCSHFDADRFRKIVGSSWNWWKAVKASLDAVLGVYNKIALETFERRAIKAQIDIARKVLGEHRHSFKWHLTRVADIVMPDGNEVDDS